MFPNLTPHLQALLDGRAIDEETLLPIEKAIRDLLAAKSREEQVESLRILEKVLPTLQPCEFRHDVEGQLGALQNNSGKQPQKVYVVDTDDYLDLLLSGTEVIGSCQSVEGSPHKNKGLLGYLLGGENRLLIVKDERGHIMARVKLSILWGGEKPALFMERLYTQGKFEEQCRAAITEMALAKAKKLKLPLTVLKGSGYL